MWWYRLYTLFPCGYLHPRIRHHGLWWGESTSCFAVKMLGKTGQLEYLQPEYHDGKSASGYSGVVFCSWVSSGELIRSCNMLRHLKLAERCIASHLSGFCVPARACSEFLCLKTLRHRGRTLLLYRYTTTRISYVTYPQGSRQKELHLAVRFSGYD